MFPKSDVLNAETSRDPGVLIAWLRKRMELSRGADSNMLAMEGLRGFAVFLVFLDHFGNLARSWVPEHSRFKPILEAHHVFGNTGVDLFFILSGYLIYGSLISKVQPFGRFMQRRVERIYPAFTVVFLIYLGLSFVFPAESKIPGDLVEGSLYVAQNFLLLPGIFPIPAMISVAWSLSYEMFFYLFLPLLIVLLRLRAWNLAPRIAFFSIALAGVIVASQIGGPIRMSLFVAGILLFEGIRNRLIGSPGSVVAIGAFVAGVLIMLWPSSSAFHTIGKTSVSLFGCFLLVLACFGTRDQFLYRVFAWTPLRWLGNMSYSYYLIHGLTLKISASVLVLLFPALVGNSAALLLLPLLFLITLVPALLLYLTIERPFSLKPAKPPVVLPVPVAQR